MAERHELGDLVLAISTEPAGILVRWLGRSTALAPDPIVRPYLNTATVRAQSLRVPLVHDFTELQFFNSSTISTLLRHFREVEGRGVPVHVRYATSQRWQRTFFSALDTARQSAARIRVEPVGT